MNTSALNSPLKEPKINKLTLGFLIFGCVVWVALFMLGLASYSGSKFAYALLSVVSGSMLVTGFLPMTSYGYLFLTVFLWLGFWLKLTIHTALTYPFVEPVGSFVGGVEAWDEVLYTATTASLSVMVAKTLFGLVRSHNCAMRREVKPIVPLWYAKNRKWLWFGLMLIGITALLVNMRYGVHQIGLAPRTVLMWPLNAGIAWLLNIGLATGISVFLWWDIVLKESVVLPLYAIIAEAFLSSVSILSRAVFVFHAIPQLWAAFRFKHMFTEWNRAKTGWLAVTFVLFLVVSISAVTTFRNYLYQSGAYWSTAYQVSYARAEVLEGAISALQLEIETAPLAEQAVLKARRQELYALLLKSKAAMSDERIIFNDAIKSGSAQSRILLNEFGYQLTGRFSTQILQLSVDRWIGLEGLMAVQAYPGKSMSLLLRGWGEKPKAGDPDIYQTISNSIYMKSDGTKFRFASLPGATAFLYYSDSLLIVSLGMFLFCLIILSLESLMYGLTSNPILCSLYGVVMANNVAQFGVTPSLSVPYFSMLVCGIFLVLIIHTSSFAQVLRKLQRH